MNLAVTTQPSTPGVTPPDPNLVTPGTIGFLFTLAIVLAAVFLIRNLQKRVRRLRARAEATDAYPIPLRRHAVPNQSDQSGATKPEPTDETVDDGAEATDSESGERPATSS